MQVWQAIILGFVQGASEFLPISSSGHLILTRQLLGIEGEYLIFDVMMHLATLGAIGVCFYKEILALFVFPFKRLILLVLSAIPAAIVGFVFKDVDGLFGGGVALSVFFLLSAIIAFSSHFLAKRATKPIDNKTVAFMSIAQCVAILPGVSRSGSTMLGGLIAGSDRKSTATFSFLMSVPIILGSALVETISLLTDGAMPVSMQCIAWGMAFAFISGVIAVKTVMKLIKNASFAWFGLYLCLVSVLNLVLVL